MRDQEIAATAKDLEMRQLELEAQKRLYEKVKAALSNGGQGCPSDPALTCVKAGPPCALPFKQNSVELS